MGSLLERQLIVVTGKGGTGKSTVACALGLIAARRGLRTIVAEVGNQERLPGLFAEHRVTVEDAEHRMSKAKRGAAPRVPRGEHDVSPRVGEGGHDEAHRMDGGRYDEAQRMDGADKYAELRMQAPESGKEIELEPGLWSTSIDPDKALFEWLRTLGGRVSVRLLAGSSTFHYFAAAAPGAKELLSLVKVRELCERSQSRDSKRDAGGAREDGAPYDLVVLDGPATGHALAMLRSPRTFASIVRVGPLAEQAQKVRELLEDPHRSGYVAVAHGTEMAVTETLELEEGLRRQLDRDLDMVIVNGTVPRRFTREELERIAGLDDEGNVTVASAARMARAVNARARLQQSQTGRLRRQRFAAAKPPHIFTLPLLFTPELDLDAIREMSTNLERKL